MLYTISGFSLQLALHNLICSRLILVNITDEDVTVRQDDVWLEDKDYPDEKDIEEFGYDSPPDYDPLTIGYIGDNRPPF